MWTGKGEEWFEGGDMGAHLDDVLEGFLGFVFQVLGAGALLQHVDGK